MTRMRQLIATAMIVAAVPATAEIGAASIAGTMGTRTFNGDGTRILQPLRYPRGAVARWSTDGNGLFMLIALRTTNRSVVNPQLIVSQRRSGVGYLPPGRYTLKVSSFGGWRLRLTPR